MRRDLWLLIDGLERRGWAGLPDVDDPAELRHLVREIAEDRGWWVRTQWRGETRIFSVARLERPQERTEDTPSASD